MRRYIQGSLEDKGQDIKIWYNGYQIGENVLYNPWSIVNCLEEQGMLKPYWANTSDNALIKKLLVTSTVEFKERFEVLLEGKSIERLINDNFVFPDIEKDETAVWSLLLMTGYLKIISSEETYKGPLCELAIPNLEIRNLFRVIIEQWLAAGNSMDWYDQFISHLLSGDVTLFARDLQKIMEQTVSVYDVGKEPEAFYHGLMIGLTASLYGRKNYETRSNRESGYSRYDYFIFSTDLAKPSILLEFKKVDLPLNKKEDEIMLMLNRTAQDALKQVNGQGYLAESRQRGVKKLLKIGIAFSGKRFGIAHEWA